MIPITKAVFPVAGLGTRFLPATKAMPKELLPIIDKPIIQYAVEEAIAAGITELVFVTGRTKRAIEDHFDTNPELERELIAKGNDDLAAAIHGIIPDHVNCIFVRQPRALLAQHPDPALVEARKQPAPPVMVDRDASAQRNRTPVLCAHTVSLVVAHLCVGDHDVSACPVSRDAVRLILLHDAAHKGAL